MRLTIIGLLVCTGCALPKAAPSRNYLVPSDLVGVLHGDSATRRSEVVRNSCAVPRYPVELQQQGVSGQVIVGFVIDTLGRAERETVRVIETTHPDFNMPAIGAVRSCRYTPGEVHGRKVRVWVHQPINFQVMR